VRTGEETQVIFILLTDTSQDDFDLISIADHVDLLLFTAIIICVLIFAR
jgi:hypothetical protein